ncbi:MAG: GNAT family N-acetyltransferase [Xanthomonadales bacterium]|nr:GNAT family N-acetyltransferase [Xanthomonadales bacterium]
MNFSIRDANVEDLNATLALNESEVPHVGSITRADMQHFLTIAVYFRVACDDQDNILAVLIGLEPGADYASLNYRWFNERYARFAYIDRIAVAPHARRLGIAETMYKDFEYQSANWAECLCCEVNLVPENPVSMSFHRRLRFEQVGTLETQNGAKKVALLMRKIG